jgi:nitrogen fixation/metabolism regulation signal transduction histidine kinase
MARNSKINLVDNTAENVYTSNGGKVTANSVEINEAKGRVMNRVMTIDAGRGQTNDNAHRVMSREPIRRIRFNGSGRIRWLW